MLTIELLETYICFVDFTEEVLLPTINIFYFDTDTSDEILLVDSQLMTASFDTGMYTYSFTIPDTVPHRTEVFIQMSGTGAVSGDPLKEYIKILAVDVGTLTEIGLARYSFIPNV